MGNPWALPPPAFLGCSIYRIGLLGSHSTMCFVSSKAVAGEGWGGGGREAGSPHLHELQRGAAECSNPPSLEQLRAQLGRSSHP